MSTTIGNITLHNIKTSLITVFLSAALIFLAVFAGWQILGGWAVLLVAGFGIAIAVSIGRSSGNVRIAGGREIRYMEAPDLHDMVRNLSDKAGVPMTPTLVYSSSPVTNAAAFGEKADPHIVVTGGLLSTLSPRELNGVLAHEIAHLKNGDQRLFRFAEVFRQVTTLFSRIGWLALLFALPLMLFGYTMPFTGFLLLVTAPLLSYLLEMALLRTREFAADAKAARITGDPLALASALGRIEYIQQGLFGRIVPISRKAETSIFRSHPATAERITKLEAIDREQQRVIK